MHKFIEENIEHSIALDLNTTEPMFPLQICSTKAKEKKRRVYYFRLQSTQRRTRTHPYIMEVAILGSIALRICRKWSECVCLFWIYAGCFGRRIFIHANSSIIYDSFHFDAILVYFWRKWKEFLFRKSINRWIILPKNLYEWMNRLPNNANTATRQDNSSLKNRRRQYTMMRIAQHIK